MTDVIEFVRPTKLMSMNDRLHWSVQRRRARAWRERAAWAAIEQLGTTSQRVRGPSTVAVSLPVAGHLHRDPHNYFLTVKHVVDGLVDAGLWPNDEPDWVTTVEPRLVQSESRGDLGLVSVTIKPRPNQTEEEST